ncbi:MAG: hypothetical protein JEZ02_01255 [Desulfatibacillum sp.]|nr:hypothetical protein [Desulfatibacillum sp.]
MKKMSNGLPLDKHLVLAGQLRQAQIYLELASEIIHQGYHRTTFPAHDITRIVNSMIHLQSMMKDRLVREHPDQECMDLMQSSWFSEGTTPE